MSTNPVPCSESLINEPAETLPTSGGMQDYAQLWGWFDEARLQHKVEMVESLPQPVFRGSGRELVSFSTNNYLGLATSPRIVARAREGLERYGVGNCESRLLGGELAVYAELEKKLATLKKKEDAILFATGYLTNLGVLSALPKVSHFARMYGYGSRLRSTYAYFSDEFNHTSIREGIRMAGVAKCAYRHRDMNHLESLLRKSDAHVKIIATDGVFSQDGDIAPLPDLLALAERCDAMVYMDDAHGTGILGSLGQGTSEHFGVTSERLIQMGTLSKAYGALGGFVATDHHIAEILRYTCSAYGFTSTIPPDQALAVAEAMDVVVDEPERRRLLWANQHYFVSLMQRLPYRLMSQDTPIVPVFIGDETRCRQLARRLKDEGMHVDAVAYPAVGLGQARLRIMLNAGHSRTQIEHLVAVLEANQSLVLG